MARLSISFLLLALVVAVSGHGQITFAPDVPPTDAPTTTTEAPTTTEEPTTTTEASTTTQEPSTEEPSTEAPTTTQEPSTEEPSTEAPTTTQEPSSEAPTSTTEASTTSQEPSTEAPVNKYQYRIIAYNAIHPNDAQGDLNMFSCNAYQEGDFPKLNFTKIGSVVSVDNVIVPLKDRISFIAINKANEDVPVIEGGSTDDYGFITLESIPAN